MAEAKKYYWLKLPKDFFKRHDITYMLSLPLGDKTVVFYLKLMTESIDHDGRLRFNKELPYTNAILASIMHVDEEFCNRSMNLFIDLGLIEIDEDETIIMTKVAEMIGSASDTDEARRSRRYRERKKAERDETSHENVTPVTEGVIKEHESKSKSKSKSKSIERNTKERKFTPPTLEEIEAYCQERNSSVNPEHFFDYYEVNSWKDSKGNPVKNWKQKLITWEKHDAPVVHCATPQKSNPYDIDWSKV